MAEPCFAITGDDARHYVSPLNPDVHKKSITTIKKQGVPNPVLDKWQVKQVALCALDTHEVIIALKAQEALNVK
jgi:hypothetical protein